MWSLTKRTLVASLLTLMLTLSVTSSASADEAAIGDFLQRYYSLMRAAHRDDRNLVEWGKLWAVDAVMEDPVDTDFGRFVGRSDIENRVRGLLQTTFEYLNMRERGVVIQPVEHRASVYWHLTVKYKRLPSIPADRRGKVVSFYGVTNFVLNSTDTEIKTMQAIWDYSTLR